MDKDKVLPTHSIALAWLRAMRLRTLPLAMASVTAGTFLATADSDLNWNVYALTIVCAIMLQITSNLANDYGDFTHGTDNTSRIGPERVLQSGALSATTMRSGIFVFAMLSLSSGLWLLHSADVAMRIKVMMLIVGLSAIYAAITYTAGNNPYGYRGLGDVSVVFFFGFAGVVGSYVLQGVAFTPWILLPALAVGGLSAGVLNLNNRRDADNDQLSGKITLAVRLGKHKAWVYHALLVDLAFIALVIYAIFQFDALPQWMFALTYPLLVYNVVCARRAKHPGALDPLLRQLALSTFLLSLLLAAGMVLTNF